MNRKGRNIKIDRQGFLTILVLLVTLLLIPTVKGG
jgi:hypothetical protein